jgi:hypothetical protein
MECTRQTEYCLILSTLALCCGEAVRLLDHGQLSRILRLTQVLPRMGLSCRLADGLPRTH